MKSSARFGFTLIELIFVIVIIGVLSAVAIPKFKNLTDNSKIAAELSTASSVQSALDAIHGEWITNTCNFDWGNGQNTSSNPLNTAGYPTDLNTSSDVFGLIFKSKTNDWVYSGGRYYGPASRTDGKGIKAASPDKPGKPDGNDYWEYNATAGTFNLIDQ